MTGSREAQIGGAAGKHHARSSSDAMPSTKSTGFTLIPSAGRLFAIQGIRTSCVIFVDMKVHGSSRLLSFAIPSSERDHESIRGPVQSTKNPG